MNNTTVSTRSGAHTLALGLTTRQFALIGMLIALEIILGLWNIPMPAGLSITFNMIPVAIAAIAIGPKGSSLIGGVFGLISFLQCFNILGSSGLGVALIGEGANPALMFIHRFGSRLLDGFLIGMLVKLARGRAKDAIVYPVTGFLAAFLNTLLFMSTLVWFFSSLPKMQDTMAGKGFFTYIVTSVGVNGLIEMAVSTILTSAIGAALKRAGFIRNA